MKLKVVHIYMYYFEFHALLLKTYSNKNIGNTKYTTTYQSITLDDS